MFQVLHPILRVVFFCFFLVSLETWSQVVPCGNPDEKMEDIQNRNRRILDLKKHFAHAKISTTPTYLPIKAHIIRRSDGTGGLSLADLNTGLVRLNQLYINSNIQFYLCGSSPNYINNTTYFSFDNSEESALCSTNDVNNAINVYFPNVITSGGTPVAGYAYFSSTSNTTNRIFVKADNVIDGHTFPHEMGHYFSLLHTFQGSNGPIIDRELVARPPNMAANCTNKGDFLCDTPADPYGRDPDSVKLLDCNYIGTVKDAQGQLFSPLLSNIMSYYPTTCGSVFTSGQYGRVTDGLTLRLDPSNQYNLNCAPVVTGVNVPSNVAGTISSSGISITFTDNSSNETGFIVERSITSPIDGFVAVGGTAPNTTTFLDQGTTAFTQYYYRVRCSNSIEFSIVFSITTTLNYCVPVYANSCSSLGVIIDDFLLAPSSGPNIIQTTSTGCSANNHGIFTATTYNVSAGQAYTFIARAVRLSGSVYFNQHIAVWVDYDRDGLFESTEMVYQSNGTTRPTMSPNATGTFTIPNITSGIVRLRIRSNFESFGQVTDPCASMSFGEAHDYHLNVAAPAPFITTGAVATTPVCAGKTVSVSFTTNLASGSYQVYLSDATGNNFSPITTTGTNSPLTATIPAATASGSGYKVFVASNGLNVTGTMSAAFTINAVPNAPTATSPVNYAQNQSAMPLSASGSNLRWYAALSGGPSNNTAPTPSTANVGSVLYYVSQTASGCESARTTIQVNVTNPATATVCLAIKVFLEGPYNAGIMVNALQQQGLLPGQTPVNQFGVPTPPGQPYNKSPFNYSGTESLCCYTPNMIDWVLISLRTSPNSPASTVYRAAALLLQNGTISLVSSCPVLNTSQTYYVAVTHRNHIGAVSHRAVSVISNTITYDFTTQQSFIPAGSPASGQRQLGAVYALFAADCNKDSFSQIDANDNGIWRADNGKIGRYLDTDYNLDGAPDATDNALWRINNGRFSAIMF